MKAWGLWSARGKRRLMALDLEVTIPHRVDLVWHTVTDFRTAPYWLGLDNLRPLDKGERIERGTRLIYDARGQAHPSTITRFERERFFSLTAQQGGITVEYAYSFEAEEGSTKVRLHAECTAVGWFWRMLVPIVRRMMERSDRDQLEALKKLVAAVAETEARQKQAKSSGQS